MSRTKKGSKSPGQEYHGKRPLEFGGKGKKDKRHGIQVERAQLKQKLKKEIKDEKK